MARKVLKSSVSGKFVSKKEVASNPRETYQMEIKVVFKGWVCVDRKGKPIPSSFAPLKKDAQRYGDGIYDVHSVTCIVN